MESINPVNLTSPSAKPLLSAGQRRAAQQTTMTHLNSTHVASLGIYPDMGAAIAAIDDMYARYLKAHKRKATVDLTVASISSPFDRSKRRVHAAPEPVELRVRYGDEQVKEAEWFVVAGATPASPVAAKGGAK